METSPAAALRQAAHDHTLLVPGAPHALAGRLIERAGADAAYLSSAALSASVLGLPDVGLLTLNELVQPATCLARSMSIPLIVDAQTGFGSAVNVERTVIELEAAGAAAIQLEDRQLPGQCGHLSGKSLVDQDSMCRKLQAAADARYDSDVVLIARTDARDVTDLQDALDRASRYLDAGADWILPEALNSREEFAEFARRIRAPLVANMTEFENRPLLKFAELAELGYAAVLYPVTLFRVGMRAMEAALHVLLDEGTQESLLDLMQTREELHELLDYSDFEQRDLERQ